MLFLLSLLKFHSGPQALQHPLHVDSTAPWGHAWCHRTLPGKWEHSSGNNSNCKGPGDTAENFSPSAFIFHLIHFPLLFHLENCHANLGWNCMGREGFLLTSRSCHLYIPLCTCQAQGLKWPAEGGFWEQPRQPVRIPKATAFPEPQTLACDSLVSYPQVSHWWANSIYYSSLLCT